MAVFDIWMEGFRLSGEGEEANASFVGRAEGASFEEACHNYYKAHISADFNPQYLSVWGCRLFPTEAEARASFG